MSMISKVFLRVVLFGTLSYSSYAQAGLLLIDSRATFDAAASGLEVQTIPPQSLTWAHAGTLDSSTSSPYGISAGDILPGIAFDSFDSTPGTKYVNIVAKNYASFAHDALFGGLNFNLSFAEGVDSVGLGLLSRFGVSDIRIRVYDLNDILIGSVVASSIPNSGEGVFFGALATDGQTIGRINLFSLSFKSAGVDRVDFGTRDLVQDQELPIPSSALLVGLALVAAGTAQARNRNRVIRQGS